MTLCLVPALFIAIYCLFIILPSTPPPVFNIDCSPRCPGAEGVSASLPPPELAPAALGAGGSGDIQALSPLMSPSRGAGQKGKQRPAEGGSASTEPLSITTTPILRGGLTSPPITGTGTGCPQGWRVWCHHLGEPQPRSLPEPRDFQRTEGTPGIPESSRPTENVRPGRDRCSRSIAAPGRARPGAPRSFPTGTTRGRHRPGAIAAAR